MIKFTSDSYHFVAIWWLDNLIIPVKFNILQQNEKLI